jgi:hypothetical protein
MGSVVLDRNVKEGLRNDVREFLEREGWYVERGGWEFFQAKRSIGRERAKGRGIGGSGETRQEPGRSQVRGISGGAGGLTLAFFSGWLNVPRLAIGMNRDPTSKR